MASIGTRELLLLVIGLDDTGAASDGISGITRLQKFIFLLEEECGIKAPENGFEFQPYKAGPYSPRLYDDLELLENMGFVQVETAAESTATETADIDGLTFGDLIGSDDERSSDAFQERRFRLTKKGKDRIESILKTDNGVQAAKGVRRIKSNYSAYSLRDLLRYIYTKYPGMTTESEIIDQVLGES